MDMLEVYLCPYNCLFPDKKTRQEEKKNIYSSSVFDMAERVLTQPDPYFQSSYDYYYAGGNLCTLRKSGSVVHATGPNLKTIGKII